MKERLGTLVRCLNCEILWLLVTQWSNPGGTVALDAIQTLCPNCNSNAYVGERKQGEADADPD